jgi:hypothetical protein
MARRRGEAKALPPCVTPRAQAARALRAKRVRCAGSQALNSGAGTAQLAGGRTA